MNYKIGNSRLGTDKGFFAIRNIRKGEIIKVLSGEIVSAQEIDRLIALGLEKIDDPLQIGEFLYLDMDEESYYFNHSCEPNSAIRGARELFAIREIKKGEEISFDYSTTVGKNSPNWRMVCHCGAKHCRRKIGNITSIPAETLRKYLEVGGLQDFIKKGLCLT